MDKKEKHIRENDPHYEHHVDPDQVAKSLPAEERNMERKHTSSVNRLWLWLGIIVLIFILLYWLFSIGIFEDLVGYFNG